MKIIYPSSLAKTIDALNDAFFSGVSLPKDERLKAAEWIAARHGLYGSYANMFAPTDKDLKDGIKVFTGERITTGAGTSHVLGEEACRALNLLKVQDRGILNALEEATAGIQERLNSYSYNSGTYCCGACTVSVWRHALVGRLRNPEELLERGVKALKAHRLEGGKWRRFPFYYTLLALNEIEAPTALSEIKHAAPVLERSLKRSERSDIYSKRRRLLAQLLLEKI
ncbi:hypothetical protein GX441_04810 [bacterium]|nr:hypothetical protein [bacterium]